MDEGALGRVTRFESRFERWIRRWSREPGASEARPRTPVACSSTSGATWSIRRSSCSARRRASTRRSSAVLSRCGGGRRRVPRPHARGGRPQPPVDEPRRRLGSVPGSGSSGCVTARSRSTGSTRRRTSSPRDSGPVTPTSASSRASIGVRSSAGRRRRWCRRNEATTRASHARLAEAIRDGCAPARVTRGGDQDDGRAGGGPRVGGLRNRRRSRALMPQPRSPAAKTPSITRRFADRVRRRDRHRAAVQHRRARTVPPGPRTGPPART